MPIGWRLFLPHRRRAAFIERWAEQLDRTQGVFDFCLGIQEVWDFKLNIGNASVVADFMHSSRLQADQFTLACEVIDHNCQLVLKAESGKILFHGVYAEFGDMGDVNLRCTSAELERVVMHFTLKSAATRAVVCKGSASMRNILSVREFVVPLYEQALLWGQLTAKADTGGGPSFTQIGDNLDVSSVTLFVLIHSVTGVAEDSSQGAVQVMVSFNDDTKITVEKRAVPCIEFGELMSFQLPQFTGEKVKQREAEAVLTLYDSCWIDAFLSHAGGREHLGHAGFSLHDIAVDSSGKLRTAVERPRVDFGKRRRVSETRVLQEKLALQANDEETNVTVEIEAYLIPDLLPTTASPSAPRANLVPSAVEFMRPAVERLQAAMAEEARDTDERYLAHQMASQRGEVFYLPSFLTKISIPTECVTVRAAMMYTRSFPYVTRIDADERWLTPDAMLIRGKGDYIDHCLLLVSLLLSMGIDAYVCLGSLGEGHRHAWVAVMDTILEPGTVYFLEAQLARVWQLPARIESVEMLLKLNHQPQLRDTVKRSLCGLKKKTVKQVCTFEGVPAAMDTMTRWTGGEDLPYKSLDLIFNNRNIHVNRQSPIPARVCFDVWNDSLWTSLVQHSAMSPFVCAVNQPRYKGRMNDAAVVKMSDAITQDIIDTLTVSRAAKSLGTRFNTDDKLLALIRKGLFLYHQAMSAHQAEERLRWENVAKWRDAISSKVPTGWHFSAQPAIHSEAHIVAKSTVITSDMRRERSTQLDLKGQSATFIAGAQVVPFAGTMLIYTLVGVIRRLQLSELNKTQEGHVSQEADREALDRMWRTSEIRTEMHVSSALSTVMEPDATPLRDPSLPPAQEADSMPAFKRRRVEFKGGAEWACVYVDKHLPWTGDFNAACGVMKNLGFALNESLNLPEDTVVIPEIIYSFNAFVLVVNKEYREHSATIMQHIKATIEESTSQNAYLTRVCGEVTGFLWKGFGTSNRAILFAESRSGSEMSGDTDVPLLFQNDSMKVKKKKKKRRKRAEEALAAFAMTASSIEVKPMEARQPPKKKSSVENVSVLPTPVKKKKKKKRKKRASAEAADEQPKRVNVVSEVAMAAPVAAMAVSVAAMATPVAAMGAPPKKKKKRRRVDPEPKPDPEPETAPYVGAYVSVENEWDVSASSKPSETTTTESIPRLVPETDEEQELRDFYCQIYEMAPDQFAEYVAYYEEQGFDRDHAMYISAVYLHEQLTDDPVQE
ncbi:MAG: LOW QUALITY PROTEIN: hypothetical protein KVP17_003334 [Porospora cf. gigantea B]|uniref:uncharacterized protein n=1 Tax=Porospora cf. gigantea B TaxID=2853592 RepID=UPI003571D3B0|nr:MAG: LOW QUALITY PROTEIN: hypothetical protein KVP17_003334 [Porospora cf. gigantea B]